MHVVVQVLCVAVGSMIGGLLRWGVGVCFGSWFGTGFPWGTFFINVSGSMFLGWFMTVHQERLVNGPGAWVSADNLRLAIAVGFTGAYTTFSTFEHETNLFLCDGNYLKGLIYVASSVVLGLGAMWLGILLAKST